MRAQACLSVDKGIRKRVCVCTCEREREGGKGESCENWWNGIMSSAIAQHDRARQPRWVAQRNNGAVGKGHRIFGRMQHRYALSPHVGDGFQSSNAFTRGQAQHRMARQIRQGHAGMSTLSSSLRTSTMVNYRVLQQMHRERERSSLQICGRNLSCTTTVPVSRPLQITTKQRFGRVYPHANSKSYVSPHHCAATSWPRERMW